MRRALPRFVAFGALPLLAACAAHHASAPDPFMARVSAADAVWAARGEAGSLDGAEAAYRALLAERPASPELLWRLARVAWSRALLAPAEARAWHETGRELALRCVAGDPAMAEPIARGGDRLVAADLVRTHVPVECFVYAAAHVVALVEARGPGAALDLEDAAPLVEAAAGLAPGVEPGLREWAAGRALVEGGGPAPDARAHFHAAVAAEPGVRFFRTDATAAFPDLADTFGPWTPAPEWRLENGGE